jgi:hypothetical protein
MDQTTDRTATAFPVPRILDGEIIPAPAPGAPVQLTPDQFSALLARVDRPVVIRGPEPYAPPAHYAPPPRGGHPGINVTYPAPEYALPAVAGPLPEVPETRTWAPVAFTVCAAAFLGGPLLALLGGSTMGAVIVCALGFAGGTRALVLLLRNG